MNENILTNEMKHTVWKRQNGMCALTGKKFDEFNDSIDAEFIFINPKDDTSDLNNVVMVWKLQDIPKGRLHKYNFQYANFMNYGQEERLADIKEEIEYVFDLSNSDENLKNTKNLIKDISNTLNSINIPNINKNELREKLVDALNNVNKRQLEQNEKNKVIFSKNYEILKSKTLEVIEFVKASKSFKEAREKLISLQGEVKNSKILFENKNELDKLINETFNDLNKRQYERNENYEMECIENYYKLKTLVDVAINKAKESETFLEAKKCLINAQNEIKEKVLRRAQKDELYSSIHSAFDMLREKFNEVRLTEEEMEANYNKVKPIVIEAVEAAKNATTIEQILEAREKLIQMQNLIKENRLIRTKSNELFSIIREVFNKINQVLQEDREQYEAESNINYEKLSSKIDVIIVEIENGIDFSQNAENLSTIKTEMQLLKLKREHRGKLYDKIRTAFNLLSKMRTKYNKRKVEEKMHKLDSIVSNLEHKITRLNALLNKDKEMLEKQTKKIEVETDEQIKESIANVIEIIKSRIENQEKNIKATLERITDIKNEKEKIDSKEEDSKKEDSKEENLDNIE